MRHTFGFFEIFGILRAPYDLKNTELQYLIIAFYRQLADRDITETACIMLV